MEQPINAGLSGGIWHEIQAGCHIPAGIDQILPGPQKALGKDLASEGGIWGGIEFFWIPPIKFLPTVLIGCQWREVSFKRTNKPSTRI